MFRGRNSTLTCSPAATPSVVKKAISNLNIRNIIYSRVGKGSFVSQRSNHIDFTKVSTVGFVLKDLDSPFFSRILSSAEKRLSEEKYSLLLSSSAGLAEKEESMINHLLDIGVSGLIIASMTREYVASPVIRKLHDQNLPYVVVSYLADEDISYVGTDHEKGAFLATEHLINLNYENIGYLNGIHENGTSLLGELRKKGYLKALEKYGNTFNPDYEYKFVLGIEWTDYQAGYEVGCEFVKTKNKPDAIFAFDDLAALGFQKALLDHGLRVPEDVAIVGFDDIKRGVTAPVPLTTVHVPLGKMGEIAAEILINKINGVPTISRKILKPSLVIRESCGAKLKGKNYINN